MSRGQVAQTGVLCLVFACLLAGCPLVPPPPGGSSDKAALQPFGSAQELVAYFRQQAQVRAFTGGPVLADLAGPAPAAAEDSAGSANADFSTTNLQEAGVDESDVVKSDGTHLYVADGDELRIVRVQPLDQSGLVASLKLPTTVDSMYLRSGRLILLGLDYSPAGVVPLDGIAVPGIWPPYYLNGVTELFEVDISDPAQPALVRGVSLDGSLVTSRLLNDRLVLVLTVLPNVPGPLVALQVDDILPQVRTAQGARASVAWENVLRPAAPNGYAFTQVVTLDANNIDSLLASMAVMANAGAIYTSPEALYITDTEYDWSGATSRETTDIHKLRFDALGVPQYTASGRVPGRPLNQFSLDEHDGALRIATHNSGTVIVVADDVAPDVAITAQPRDPSNAVYVLAEAGSELAVQGKIEGLAPGEQIYSARFMGDRGFLVTFQQVDPLFAMDLSDPANPQIVGELKIPGYSDYLHPLGETHLIGVGRSVSTVPGGVLRDALQLSIFDVQDLANPTVVQQLEIGGFGSYSDVSYTHKAFTLLGDRLALPARLAPQAASPFSFSLEFGGVLVFQVDPATGFTEIARVADAGQTEFYQSWQRAALIADDALAISPAGVRVQRVDDPTQSRLVDFD